MKNIIPFLVLSQLLCACVGTRNNYGLGIISNLPYEIHETRAYVGDRYFAGAGYLGPSDGTQSGGFEHGIREPVPEIITLQWKEPSGTLRKIDVSLKGKVPAKLRDQTIILTITSNKSVRVSLKKNIQVWDN